ncbi:Phosphate-specific transport system accessory protein PhoU [bacterium HR40]|nr:Phosphate-specific transport system accessory protein PhoU [bacterium HR40]
MPESGEGLPIRKHTVRSFDEELEHLTRQIVHMGALVERQVAEAIRALVERDGDTAARVVQQDDEVDELEEAIDQEAIRILATRQPMAIDLRMVAMALKISNDLERTSDYAVNIARRVQRLIEQPPLKPLVTIPRMAELVQLMIKDVLDAYVRRDAERALDVWRRDEEVDQYYNSLFRELLTYILEDPRRTSMCIDLLFIAKNLERIGDHATNIAEKIRYIVHGDLINRMSRDVKK